jgi:predicted ATPase
MVHLGPTRDAVLPTYANKQFAGFGLRGSQVPQLLRLDEALADEVGAWYTKHMEGWRLSLKRDSDSFSLQLSLRGKLSANLAQGGEGLQQVLAVVVHQLWRQRSDSSSFLDVVEQPELHLHAAAQAPLADLFIDTAVQGRGQVLVETHSEPILLRVQRRVAEGRLLPEQVSLYFVEMGNEGSQLRPVDIHPDGELDWWPPGVFEEDFREVAAISRAQRARVSSEGRP